MGALSMTTPRGHPTVEIKRPESVWWSELDAQIHGRSSDSVTHKHLREPTVFAQPHPFLAQTTLTYRQTCSNIPHMSDAENLLVYVCKRVALEIV